MVANKLMARMAGEQEVRRSRVQMDMGTSGWDVAGRSGSRSDIYDMRMVIIR
jgi:hypothetical protein